MRYQLNTTAKCSNSFVVYCREHRNNLKEKYPDLTSAQITSLLAHNWKKLNQQMKKEYIDKAKRERVS